MTATNLLGTLGAAALLATGSPLVALTTPLFVMVVYYLQHIYLLTSRQIRLLDLEMRGPLFSHFLETIEGLPTIRAFGWERQFTETNIRYLDDSQRPFYFLFCVQRWLSLVLDLMAAAMAVLVVGLGIKYRHLTDPGSLGVSMTSVLNFNVSLSQFINGFTVLETSLGAISRLRNFVRNTPVEEKDGEDKEPPPEWPSRGLVEIKDVAVYHKYGLLSLQLWPKLIYSSPTAPTLQNVTLTFLPGQRVGICGRTGRFVVTIFLLSYRRLLKAYSGKSTLLSTILRTIDIAAGSISIDGVDLSTLPRTTIRHHLTVVPQSPIHIPGSVRQNIDPLSQATDLEITFALQRVRLNDILQERGDLSAEFLPDSLSKGQGQLLALARALLQKNKIILLDEATSSVDAETDRVVKEVVREGFKGCTVITVAHRPATILDSDIVVVLENGKVVEVGEPEELIGRESRLRNLLRGEK